MEHAHILEVEADAQNIVPPLPQLQQTGAVGVDTTNLSDSPADERRPEQPIDHLQQNDPWQQRWHEGSWQAGHQSWTGSATSEDRWQQMTEAFNVLRLEMQQMRQQVTSTHPQTMTQSSTAQMAAQPSTVPLPAQPSLTQEVTSQPEARVDSWTEWERGGQWKTDRWNNWWSTDDSWSAWWPADDKVRETNTRDFSAPPDFKGLEHLDLYINQL